MDIPRPERKRQKRIRQAAIAGGVLLVLVLVTVGLARLEPAAPSVPRASVWIDTVQEGEMLRQVRGPGTLVPRNIRWIGAQTDGRVEVVVVRPGAIVEADTVLVESTYGDRDHPADDQGNDLAVVIRETAARGGKVVIPAFAIGRVEELL